LGSPPQIACARVAGLTRKRGIESAALRNRDIVATIVGQKIGNGIGDFHARDDFETDTSVEMAVLRGVWLVNRALHSNGGE
jgi:hypothetical protein